LIDAVFERLIRDGVGDRAGAIAGQQNSPKCSMTVKIVGNRPWLPDRLSVASAPTAASGDIS
jgi:hypothetical protein